jgi:hypothetical protein
MTIPTLKSYCRNAEANSWWNICVGALNNASCVGSFGNLFVSVAMLFLSFLRFGGGSDTGGIGSDAGILQVS